MKDYGKVLKELRVKNKMTQEQLGRELGLDRSIISKLENNSTNPNMEHLELYCKYFNISLDEIINEIPKEKPSINTDLIKQYFFYVLLSMIGILLSPFGIVLCLISTVLSIKKKMPIIIIVFSIVAFLFCLDDVLFIFGIHLWPALIIIS